MSHRKFLSTEALLRVKLQHVDAKTTLHASFGLEHGGLHLCHLPIGPHYCIDANNHESMEP